MTTHALTGRSVLITGASSGIGEAVAHAVASAGARLLLWARREERLEAVADTLRKGGIEVHTAVVDVRDPAAVEAALAVWNAPIDLLVNNAGLSRTMEPVHRHALSDIDDMLDTNVKGLLYVTRAVLPGMLERNLGHIVNIGSTAGWGVYPGGVVYCASKHAVHALSEGLKMDVHGTPLRVTNIAPGLVETEFSLVRFHGDAERASRVYADTTPLTPADVADAVLYAVTRPPHVNIADITLMPTVQSAPSLIHRRPSS